MDISGQVLVLILVLVGKSLSLTLWVQSLLTSLSAIAEFLVLVDGEWQVRRAVSSRDKRKQRILLLLHQALTPA